MENQMSELLLTAEQVAERLQVPPSTIKYWARIGRIPRAVSSKTVQRFVFDDVVAALSPKRTRKAVAHAG
jgi:predicted site-specific integrase-resolvase